MLATVVTKDTDFRERPRYRLAHVISVERRIELITAILRALRHSLQSVVPTDDRPGNCATHFNRCDGRSTRIVYPLKV